MQIEINAAQRRITVGLTQDDRNLIVQGDAMAHPFATIQIRFDGLVHQ